jgi:hypothetical protein
MGWIKRNLYFFISSLVALGIMGWGGYYLYTQYSEEGQVAEEIKKQSAELDRLTKLKPNPGKAEAGSIDNVKAARDQEAALRAYIAKVGPDFQRIPPIPDVGAGNVPSREFLKQLDNTVAHLQRAADQNNVKLPPAYYFTFQSQKNMAVITNTESVNQFAVHLGEVKVLSELLFDARVNELKSIRREMIPPTDTNTWDFLGPDQHTVSTPLADLTPYEVIFDCFSGDLANVMGNLANSPHGFVVKIIDVEPAGAGPDFAASNQPTPTAPPGSRFAPAPAGARAGAPGGGATGARGSSVPYLSERLLRVTLQIQLIKPHLKK